MSVSDVNAPFPGQVTVKDLRAALMDLQDNAIVAWSADGKLTPLGAIDAKGARVLLLPALPRPLLFPDLTWVEQTQTVDAEETTVVKALDDNPGWRLLATGVGKDGQVTLTYGWPWL